MPAIAKSLDVRQRRNRPAELEAMPSAPVAPAIPLPPEGLSDELRLRWGALWTSPVAQLFDPVSDRAAVARLFELYTLIERIDEQLDDADPRGRAAELVRDGGGDALEFAAAIAEASAARQAFNSTVGARVRVATEARMLEAQLGLSPRSRLALGLTVLAGRAAAQAGGLDAAADAANF